MALFLVLGVVGIALGWRWHTATHAYERLLDERRPAVTTRKES